ncbi:hypothetical protein ACX80K_08760 [Arthrobacter sp. MDT1-65]
MSITNSATPRLPREPEFPSEGSVVFTHRPVRRSGRGSVLLKGRHAGE